MNIEHNVMIVEDMVDEKIYETLTPQMGFWESSISLNLKFDEQYEMSINLSKPPHHYATTDVESDFNYELAWEIIVPIIKEYRKSNKQQVISHYAEDIVEEFTKIYTNKSFRIRKVQLEHMLDESPLDRTSAMHKFPELIDDATSRWVIPIDSHSFVISQEVIYPPEAGEVKLEFVSEYIDYNDLSDKDKTDAYSEFGMSKEVFWDNYPSKTGRQLVCELVFQWRN